MTRAPNACHLITYSVLLWFVHHAALFHATALTAWVAYRRVSGTERDCALPGAFLPFGACACSAMAGDHMGEDLLCWALRRSNAAFRYFRRMTWPSSRCVVTRAISPRSRHRTPAQCCDGRTPRFFIRGPTTPPDAPYHCYQLVTALAYADVYRTGFNKLTQFRWIDACYTRYRSRMAFTRSPT